VWVSEPGLTFWRRRQLISGDRIQDRAAQICHILFSYLKHIRYVIDVCSVAFVDKER